LSDIVAYVVGKTLGRHPLAPRLSPNKTVEGVAGNLLGAYIGVAIMGFALPSDTRMATMLGLPLLVGLGALWGDLVESALKREFSLKDAGAWLPGFGGLLDRIDSLIIVLPLTYHTFRLAT
jgi:phosphatidate cytidylyltransferase